MGLRGGQQQLLLLARGLHKRGHDQLIVCPESSALESQTRQEEFRVFSLPPHDPAHAHGIFQLRQQLTAEPFEILHSHDGRGQTIAWLASCGLPVRRVASRRVTFLPRSATLDRKSTRLNSSHDQISYAVFCLKKKKRGFTADGGMEIPTHPLPTVDHDIF